MVSSVPGGERRPALVMVLAAIVSVQFGGALAATLVPEIGSGGSVLLRLGIATVLLLVIVRPRWRGHSRRAWRGVLALGVALGLMNWSFYGALAHLPIGVAVTIEFLGPLVLAAVLSRASRDLVAVAFAALGVVLISGALTQPWASLSWAGILLAATAGVCWAAYILTSRDVGATFERLDGLALAMVVATIVVLPAGLTTAGDWTSEHLLKGLGIAVLSSVLPYSLELIALRTITPGAFGILLSLEPAVAALAGLIVLSQGLSPLELGGMALVVGASAIVMGVGEAGREPPDPADLGP